MQQPQDNPWYGDHGADLTDDFQDSQGDPEDMGGDTEGMGEDTEGVQSGEEGVLRPPLPGQVKVYSHSGIRIRLAVSGDQTKGLTSQRSLQYKIVPLSSLSDDSITFASRKL